MRSNSPILFLVVAILTLPGCGGSATKSGSEADADLKSIPKVDTHQSLLSEMTELMNEVYAIVEPVNDDASARAAAEEIEKLQPRGESITIRLEALEQPPEDEIERLKGLLREEITEVNRKIDEVNRIGSKYRELRMALNAVIPAF